MNTPFSLAPLLERFFTQRLMHQREASPHTIGSYRDTFRQLLKFIEQRLHKAPSNLMFEQIDAPVIVAFLDHLEKNQGLSIRSRNLRLTAIHSFFRYAALEAPAYSADPTRTRDSQQALYPVLSPLSFAARSGCAARCARPTDLARTSRSRVYPRGGTDRFAPVGNDRTEARGCPAWNRISCPGDRQGSQGTVHAAE